MDPPLTPPVLIRPNSSTSITTKAARKLMKSYLEDFKIRTTAAQGGNTAVAVQLEKLGLALDEERELRKKGESV